MSFSFVPQGYRVRSSHDTASGEAVPPALLHRTADPRGRACRADFAQHETGISLCLLVAPDGFVELIGSPGSVRPHADHRISFWKRDSVVKVVAPRQPSRSNRTILAEMGATYQIR